MSCLKSWFQKRWKEFVKYFLFLSGFNLYYLFLMRERHIKYLFYLDLLYVVFLAAQEAAGFYSFCKREKRKSVLLGQQELIYQEFADLRDSEITEHDIGVLEEQLKEKFEENVELQDYVAKWCHECKLPLSAALMMTENIEDDRVRGGIRQQLERINWQLGAMLQGCRLQSPLFDLQVKRLPLEECVRASIQNNRFFLIQKKFTVKLEIGDAVVYTDKTWLTYILDQLINNAVKYAKEEAGEPPSLKLWSKTTEKGMELLVEDAGEGIMESDRRRIFEKGFTGGGCHNGKYKSTGMGLYMVKKIADRLGLSIWVESEYGKYSRFHILFLSRQ